VDGVEILVEVIENGKAIAVMVQSDTYHGLRCVNLVSQIGNIMLNLKHHHCSHVSYKTYVVNPDCMEMDFIPIATSVPRVEASSVLYAIKNSKDYVLDSDGAKVGSPKFNWLHKFTLKG